MKPIFTWELDRSTGDKEQQPEMPFLVYYFGFSGCLGKFMEPKSMPQ